MPRYQHHLSAALLVVLVLTSPSPAAIVDLDGVGTASSSLLLALDDGGRLWRYTNDCGDWRLTDTITGARAMDWYTVSGTAIVGAIVTDTELLIGQAIRLKDIAGDQRWMSVSDPETMLVHLVAPRTVAGETPEEAPAETTAEPEIIKKGKGEEEEG